MLSWVIAQDASFREDQLYFGIAYPYFSSPDSGLAQNKLSYSLAAGFIRDMPLNKSRKIALGVGVGWDQLTVFSNTRFENSNGAVKSTVIDQVYAQNALYVQSIAIPVELRWRNATGQKHAFWRIHTGISVHFPLKLSATFEGTDGLVAKESLPRANSLLRWKLHFGFNTWNISIVHDLQPWSGVAKVGTQQDIKFTKIGLIFYLF